MLQPLVKGAPRPLTALPGSPAVGSAAECAAHDSVSLSAAKGCAAQAASVVLVVHK